MNEVYFNGLSGRIEGRYYPNKDKSAPVALILHPDPSQGGTMRNLTTNAMLEVFVEVGCSSLVINFPGVGKSEGKIMEEQNDFLAASAALDWLQHNNPDASHYWVGGFSYGSFIAMQLASRRPEIEHFVLASPPVDRFDFSFASPCPLPGIVVAGDSDQIVSLDKITKAVNDWKKKKDSDILYDIIAGADHFFKNHLDEFRSKIRDYINICLAMRVAKPVKKKRRKRRKREVLYGDFD